MNRRHACGLAVLMCLCGAASVSAVSLEEVRQPTPASVEALAELGRVGEPGATQVVIRGALGAKRAGKLLGLVRAVHRDVGRRFGFGQDRTGRPIQVCLFATTAAYRTFVSTVMGPDTFEADLGFFSPYRRLVAADLGRRGEGVLRHELVHALLSDLPGRLPYWVEEGLASLYVDARQTEAGLVFGVGHRLDDLKSLRKAGRLPALDTLTGSGDLQVYGPGWRGYYALGRFVLLHLESKGQLDGFVTELRAGELTQERQRALLKKRLDPVAFWKWVEGLK
jgi:hypothetical protein